MYTEGNMVRSHGLKSNIRLMLHGAHELICIIGIILLGVQFISSH